jgi:hypothetical protein
VGTYERLGNEAERAELPYQDRLLKRLPGLLARLGALPKPNRTAPTRNRSSLHRQSVTNIPTVAAVMMTAVAQPSHRKRGGLTRFPITVGSLVRRMTSTINGDASTPLTTADQNSMATALSPTKFRLSPTSIETATTA